MEQVSDSTTALALPTTAAAQLAYHVRMAAVFAAAGDTAECASEAVLAWTMLATCWDGAVSAAESTASELVGQSEASTSTGQREVARARAEAQALELEAHFVSVGLHAEATLYETVAEHLAETIATLVNDA